MENNIPNTVGKEDLDLTVHYKEFDRIFLINNQLYGEKEIVELVVVGRTLNTSSEKRKFQYHCVDYPISVFLPKIRHFTISKGDKNVFETRKEAVEEFIKRETDKLNEKLEGIK